MARLSGPLAAAAPMAVAELRPRLPLNEPSVRRVSLRSGESLTTAVERMGVPADEASQVVALLGHAIDTAHLEAGLALHALVSSPRPQAPAKLVKLDLRTGPASAVSLSRGPGGDLRLHETVTPVRHETHLASGVMQGSLYDSALRAGASPALVNQAAGLFAKTLDFSRDIQPGDPFRLVFERTATADGRTVATGDLLFAEVGAKGRTTRFYRFEHDGKVEFVDEVGQELKSLLLKTPLEGARLTSTFGMRLHPLLHFTRLHPGVDFGAASGTPVFAAGDGTVEEARWAGGYGRWLKLRHAQGYETGYGHLSRYAPGIRAGVARATRSGDRVRRIDRALHRPAPSLRGAPERTPNGPAERQAPPRRRVERRRRRRLPAAEVAHQRRVGSGRRGVAVPDRLGDAGVRRASENVKDVQQDDDGDRDPQRPQADAFHDRRSPRACVLVGMTAAAAGFRAHDAAPASPFRYGSAVTS